MKARFLIVLLVLSCAGCGLWNKTKKFYNGYLFKTKVETKTVQLSPEEEHFVTVFYPVDVELDKLLRRLGQIESLPTKYVLTDLCQSFPWVSGGFVLDAHQEIKVSVTLSKRQLTNLRGKENLKRFFADQELGVFKAQRGNACLIYREIKDFYGQKGTVVLVIDLKRLLAHKAGGEQLIVLVPGQVLWEGGLIKAADVFSYLDWKDLLKDKVQGKLSLQGMDYHWFVRYLGKQALIYICPWETE